MVLTKLLRESEIIENKYPSNLPQVIENKMDTYSGSEIRSNEKANAPYTSHPYTGMEAGNRRVRYPSLDYYDRVSGSGVWDNLVDAFEEER